MKALMLSFGLLFASFSATAATGFCEKYTPNATYIQALQVVAGNMQYGFDELCQLPRLADIYVTKRVFVDPPKNEPVPHVWVTLHYNEYSCQYFVREADMKVTRSNCYNTF
ncbi:MAG: hypothetical protein KF681_18090 [Bdellovibrionaceae bacterium]|nr:hypothetical protein [Pseudobdellovibrionaceae bacterium]